VYSPTSLEIFWTDTLGDSICSAAPRPLQAALWCGRGAAEQMESPRVSPGVLTFIWEWCSALLRSRGRLAGCQGAGQAGGAQEGPGRQLAEKEAHTCEERVEDWTPTDEEREGPGAHQRCQPVPAPWRPANPTLERRSGERLPWIKVNTLGGSHGHSPAPQRPTDPRVVQKCMGGCVWRQRFSHGGRGGQPGQSGWTTAPCCGMWAWICVERARVHILHSQAVQLIPPECCAFPPPLVCVADCAFPVSRLTANGEQTQAQQQQKKATLLSSFATVSCSAARWTWPTMPTGREEAGAARHAQTAEKGHDAAVVDRDVVEPVVDTRLHSGWRATGQVPGLVPAEEGVWAGGTSGVAMS